MALLRGPGPPLRDERGVRAAFFLSFPSRHLIPLDIPLIFYYNRLINSVICPAKADVGQDREMEAVCLEGKNILALVDEQYASLSPVQKRIADYIFKYPDETCFHTLKKFSETLGVTEVTVLRFVKKIGLGSFVEMKQLLQEYLQSIISHDAPLSRVSDRIGGKEPGSKAEMFREFAENELQVIKSTYEKLDFDQMMAAVAMLKQAGTVYVVGSELTTGVSSYFSRRLMTIGVNAIDLGCVTRAIYNGYMSHAGPEDAVVIFSCPGYSKHVINTARYLKGKRVPQILVTDKETAPAAPYATALLLCDNHDLFFYNSMLGYFSAASLLAHFAAMYDLEETNRLRGRMSEARGAIGSLSMA